MTVKITFTLRDGQSRDVMAEEGQTLLQVAHANQIDIEGACGGAMACSTCHLIIAPEWYKKLPAPSVDEADMLDLAPGLTKTSRLGCQIKVSASMDGLSVKLPKTTKSLLG